MSAGLTVLALALLVAGVVVLLAGDAVLATAIGWALIGVAGVLAVSLAFLLVGQSEDRDRTRHPGG